MDSRLVASSELPTSTAHSISQPLGLGGTATLMLRVTMETAVVAALAWWGYRAGGSAVSRVALAVVAPAVGFGIWGAVDFHQAGRYAEPLRLIEELVISGIAALALYLAGSAALGWSLAGLSAVYHALVYARGERLLKPHAAARAATS